MSVSINSLIFFWKTGREYRGNYWPAVCPNGILYFSINFQENLLKKFADDRASQQKKRVDH